jgi:hypothetical protein
MWDRVHTFSALGQQPPNRTFDLELFEEFIGKQVLHDGVKYEIYDATV